MRVTKHAYAQDNTCMKRGRGTNRTVRNATKRPMLIPYVSQHKIVLCLIRNTMMLYVKICVFH